MRLIDADALQKDLAQMWYDSQISITGISVSALIDNQPTIEIENVRNALILMVLQYCTEDDGYLWNSCMEAGEEAFKVLGVKNGDSADELWARLEGEEKDETD